MARRTLIFCLLLLTAPVKANEYEVVLVNDDHIVIAGVQIMSVEYANMILNDYVDTPLHVRGHVCATSDKLYHLLKHVFSTNKHKPLISSYGIEETHGCMAETLN